MADSPKRSAGKVVREAVGKATVQSTGQRSGQKTGQAGAKVGKSGSAGEDVALICGRTDDNSGLRVLRRREDRIELGTIRPLKDGEPLRGEVVRLKPRRDQPLLCDVEVEWSPNQLGGGVNPAGERANGDQVRAGDRARARNQRSDAVPGRPPQVATEAYRRNWDSIWKPGRPARGALN